MQAGGEGNGCTHGQMPKSRVEKPSHPTTQVHGSQCPYCSSIKSDTVPVQVHAPPRYCTILQLAAPTTADETATAPKYLRGRARVNLRACVIRAARPWVGWEWGHEGAKAQGSCRCADAVCVRERVKLGVCAALSLSLLLCSCVHTRACACGCSGEYAAGTGEWPERLTLPIQQGQTSPEVELAMPAPTASRATAMHRP